MKLNLPLSPSQYAFPVLVILLSGLLMLLSNQVHYLDYSRDALQHGHLYTLITGHLMHTNAMHWLLNCSALVLLWALHGDDYSIANQSALYLVLCVLLSVCIYIFTPDLERYVGLSGVLHGIFVWGSIQDIRKGMFSGYLLLLGVSVKVIYEQYFGADPAISALINAPVAIDAHLYGAVIGLLYALGVLVFTNLVIKKAA